MCKAWANKVWQVYHKFLFSKQQSWYNNDNFQFVALISIKLFCMLEHFYTASLFTNLLAVSESSIKIKLRLHCTFFIILLTAAVIYKERFCVETRLCNIIKAANSITLVNTILESTYKVLQNLWKETIFKRTLQISNTVQF